MPHLVTLHGYDVSYSDAGLRAARKVAWTRYARGRRALMASGSSFVCVSEHVLALAVGLGLDPARAVVLPTGVDTGLLRPSSLPSAPHIVHVARLVEKKGTADLVDAVAALRRGGVPAELDVIGDGPLRASLLERVERAGIAGAVRFHGVQDHAAVLRAIRAARVLCQPSVTAASGDAEGLGQVLLEAGALGRPVVATRHGGIPEAVEHGENGLLVAERDARALADALGEVLDPDGPAEALAAGGVLRVGERFDLARQSARLADVYDALVDGRPLGSIPRNAADVAASSRPAR